MCIWEVVGSNPSRDTIYSYTGGVLLWFSSVPEGKLCNNTSLRSRFLPNPSQFIRKPFWQSKYWHHKINQKTDHPRWECGFGWAVKWNCPTVQGLGSIVKLRSVILKGILITEWSVTCNVSPSHGWNWFAHWRGIWIWKRHATVNASFILIPICNERLEFQIAELSRSSQ